LKFKVFIDSELFISDQYDFNVSDQNLEFLNQLTKLTFPSEFITHKSVKGLLVLFDADHQE